MSRASPSDEKPSASDAECVQPRPENPACWQHHLVLLLGGSLENDLFLVPDLEAHLNLLATRKLTLETPREGYGAVLVTAGGLA